MSRASQSERQLGYALFREEFVDALPDLFAAEARQLGEQRRRVDLDDHLAVPAAEHLTVLALLPKAAAVWRSLPLPVLAPFLAGARARRR
jgi:hypothetical protein